MEKIIQSHSELLKPLVLYRTDIESIVSIMQELSSNVEISTNEARWADLKELWEHKTESFTNLKIVTRNPQLLLHLGSGAAWLYISEDSFHSRGAFEKIKTLLERRMHPLYSHFEPLLVAGIASALFTYSLVGVIRASSQESWLSIMVNGTIMFVSLWLVKMTYQVNFHKFATIIPKHRHEVPSFFARNSDKIILAIISGVIGSCFTLLLKELTGR